MTSASSDTSKLKAVCGFLATVDMAGRPVAEDEELLASGLLDSLKILSLVTFVEQETGTPVPLEDVVPENFGTPRDVSKYMTGQTGTIRE